LSSPRLHFQSLPIRPSSAQPPATMQSAASILDQLEHLVFDENKLISAKWLSNHFEVHIERSKKILADFASQHGAKLLVHHCITGHRTQTIHHPNPFAVDQSTCSESVSAFSVVLVADRDLEAVRSSFDRIGSVAVHSVARSESESIADFHSALYAADREQQHSKMTAFLSQRNTAAHPLRFSAISSDEVRTVGPPPLHRAIAPSNTARNDNVQKQRAQTVDEAVSEAKESRTEKKSATPLKSKFEGLALGQNTRKKELKKGGIAACFAKQKKRESAGKTEGGKAADSKSSGKAVAAKKATASKVEPARKRKRGAEALEEDNLVAIEYDDESSESERRGHCQFDEEEDAELEAIKKRSGGTPSKRRKIADSEDDDEDGDEDIDILAESADDKKQRKKAEKAAARAAAKEQRERERAQKMADRKQNFFGGATANKTAKRKRYKKVARSYVDGKGMLVTEDVEVTDDEHSDGGQQHRHQQPVDDDQENDTKRANGGKAAAAKKVAKKKKAVAAKKATPGKKKKNGSITSFFKAK